MSCAVDTVAGGTSRQLSGVALASAAVEAKPEQVSVSVLPEM